MYQEFFGLREKPFGLTPDPKFLFFSEKHREALDHLLYGIHQKEGFVLITGDTGTGKTTLCRALLERLNPHEVRTSVVLNPLLNEEELLKAILEDFGLPSAGTTRKELLDVLNSFLLQTLAAGRTAVLIIDEAQHLSTECLEQVRLFSNLETHKEKLIQIILVGSEELSAKLESVELRHLQQRISLRYHLRPLDKKETRRYLQHRLNMARAAGSTSFDSRAHREIYRFSKGVPRLINIIAERSLLAAYLAESRKIRQTHVVEGRQSLNGRFPKSRPSPLKRFRHRWKEASIALSALLIASALVFVPTIREMFRSYVNSGFTQKSFAPLSYSRQFVRAEIPQPQPAAMRRPIPAEERNAITPLPINKDSSVEQPAGSSGSRSREVKEDESEGRTTAGLAKSDKRPSKERFPQYLLKPPYVYTVQVESFKDPEIAAARMRELQNRGFDAWVAWIDLGEMGTWYRVLVGKYQDKGEAQIMARKLSQKSEFQRARQIATHKESPKAREANKN